MRGKNIDILSYSVLVPVVVAFLAGWIIVYYFRRFLGRRDFEKGVQELSEKLTKNSPNVDQEAVKSELRKQAYVSGLIGVQPIGGLFSWLYDRSLTKLSKLLGQ